ncbi:hypothetical protein K438DRAFT_1766449 [Mycena galopus ATCC 62051]|nr:hypothetical protein K438DRAFT_1766449 [Mycena galopus ATCC 62051]
MSGLRTTAQLLEIDFEHPLSEPHTNLGRGIISSGRTNLDFDLDHQHLWVTQLMASQNSSPIPLKKTKKPLTDWQRESRRLASARYRQRNRDAVLKAGRERAARRRANPSKPTKAEQALARAQSRETSARYRAGHRDELVLKQRKARRDAYIKKHGLSAFLRRHIAPRTTALATTGMATLGFTPTMPWDRRRWRSAASARYRGRHRDAVLKASCERSARRRAFLKGLNPTDKRVADARSAAQCSSAIYRARAESAWWLPTWPFFLPVVFPWTGTTTSHTTTLVAVTRVDRARLVQAARKAERQGHSNLDRPSFFPLNSSSQSTGSFTMPCSPPYYPSAGHESTWAHDHMASCVYYAVWAGRVRGIYTNSWIATDQTSGFTDSVQKGFKKLADLTHWWHGLCLEHHRHGCPAFEPVNFTLNPPASTHPSTNPCTLHPPGHQPCTAPAAPAALAAPTAAAATAPAPARDPPIAAGSPFSSTSTSLFASDSPLTSAESTPASSPQKDVKEELSTPSLPLYIPPRVGPHTRVQLTPTGHARGAALVAVAARTSATAPSAAVPRRVVPTVKATPRGRPDGGATPAPHPLVLVTPARGAAGGEGGGGPPNPPPAPAAAPAIAQPPPAPPGLLYGIRGVSVFYQSHAAAWAAAHMLGLTDVRIMVTSNVAKLEAWMMMRPFVGEDEEP